MALCSTTIKAHCFTLAYDNLFFTIDVLHSQTLHTLWVCQHTELYHCELTKKLPIKYHTMPHLHLLPNNVIFTLVTTPCHISSRYHTVSYFTSLRCVPVSQIFVAVSWRALSNQPQSLTYSFAYSLPIHLANHQPWSSKKFLHWIRIQNLTYKNL